MRENAHPLNFNCLMTFSTLKNLLTNLKSLKCVGMASIDLFHHNNFQQFKLFGRWISPGPGPTPLLTHSHSLTYSTRI